MPRKAKSTKPEILGVLGVGLDSEDGHQRITKADEVTLVGGSEETHEKMQDVAIRFNEGLKNRGKVIQEASFEEVVDLLYKAMDH